MKRKKEINFSSLFCVMVSITCIILSIIGFYFIFKPKQVTYSLTINDNVPKETKVLVLSDYEKDEWLECDNQTTLKYGDLIKIENASYEIVVGGYDGVCGNIRFIISGVEKFYDYYKVLNNVTLEFSNPTPNQPISIG